MRYHLLFIIVLFACGIAYAQERRTCEEKMRARAYFGLGGVRVFCVDDAMVQEAWSGIQKRCNDRKTNNLELNAEEFISYMKMLEKENPDSDWKKLIAKLHYEAYLVDIDRTFASIRLFQHGSETDGYQKVKLPCKNFPKFIVYNGKRIDIGHSYAGLRSNLNRRFGLWKGIMARVNTNWGDYYQNIERSLHNTWIRVTFSGNIDNNDYAPPDQLAGNEIGLWLRDYYGNDENKNKSLSQAYNDYFSQTER